MVKRKVFRTPFIAIAEETNYNDAYLIGHKGEVSSIYQIDNKVPIYSADEEAYRSFHSTFLNIVKLLEKDYYLQKIDIISRRKHSSNSGDTFLAKSFNAHFNGRMYNQLTTYLVITKAMGRMDIPRYSAPPFRGKVHHHSEAKYTTNSGAKYTTIPEQSAPFDLNYYTSGVLLLQ